MNEQSIIRNLQSDFKQATLNKTRVDNKEEVQGNYTVTSQTSESTIEH